MADETISTGGAPPDNSRRKLLKIAAAAGGAVAATAIIPGSWTKPIAQIGALPAHAQTSQTPISLTAPQLLGSTLILPAPPDGARVTAAVPTRNIQVTCNWEDPLAQFGVNSYLNTLVTSGGCATNDAIQNYPYWDLFKNPATGYTTGTLTFNVITTCVNGTNLDWYVTEGLRSSGAPIGVSLSLPA
jgi:hypothetical protein